MHVYVCLIHVLPQDSSHREHAGTFIGFNKCPCGGYRFSGLRPRVLCHALFIRDPVCDITGQIAARNSQVSVAEDLGLLRGGSLSMSHFKFKKSQCTLSLDWQFSVPTSRCSHAIRLNLRNASGPVAYSSYHIIMPHVTCAF